MSRVFDHLIFDLDDTLLDTYQQLIPQALREACAAMVSEGLNTDVDSCVAAARSTTFQNRKDVFISLVQHFGVNATEVVTADGLADEEAMLAAGDDVVRAGHEAFYNRDVELNITLFPEVAPMIADLRQRYGIHLVTAGHRRTQEAKIRILGLEKMFDTITHVDPSKGERKRNAFRAILQKTKVAPERLLSVGNRVDTDIGEARELGIKACWVRYGEHVHLLPSNEFEKPDFVIDRIGELAKVCQL